MAEFPQSREEAILQATINGEEYTGYPESRIEELLLELKAVIEAGGGGGGGTTNYNLLENKPQIGGVTLTGDKSASDLSLASTSRLADAENMVCAEFFDVTKTYKKDTYVIYNDGLYKFKSAHAADAAWDATIVDEVDLLTVIQEATNPTIAPPVLNKESVVSENDVNSLSANFTAQQTSAYMLILSICNSESFPTLTSCTVSVNSEDKAVSDYYASEGYGIASKYVLLNLEAGDSIAASIASNVDNYGTSASIMLVRMSSSINGLTLKDSEFANNYTDPAISFNVEKEAIYLLWFFNRGNGVGSFKTIKLNNVTITSNKIICSSGSGWQISHGMCMVAAKPSDVFALATQFDGYFDAVGVFEVLMDTGESYNDLKDKPQIGGVTLTGNKTASQLGLVAAEQGKGLSTNDYTNAEKTKLNGIATGANKKHKKLYTLTANNWRASQSDYGVYTYRLMISDPYFDINEPLNVYSADGHDSYDDPYFNNAKYKVFKNIYNGEYGGSVEDYPTQLVLYYYDPINLTAPSTTINIYVEGIVKEWGV